jgi:hypothetical protein
MMIHGEFNCIQKRKISRVMSKSQDICTCVFDKSVCVGIISGVDLRTFRNGICWNLLEFVCVPKRQVV